MTEQAARSNCEEILKQLDDPAIPIETEMDEQGNPMGRIWFPSLLRANALTMLDLAERLGLSGEKELDDA